MTQQEAERVREEALAAGYAANEVRVTMWGPAAAWRVYVHHNPIETVAQWEAMREEIVACQVCGQPSRPLHVAAAESSTCLWLCAEHRARYRADFWAWLRGWVNDCGSH